MVAPERTADAEPHCETFDEMPPQDLGSNQQPCAHGRQGIRGTASSPNGR
jgi:hypothetical protein